MSSLRVHCAAPLSATTVLWRAGRELRVSLLARADFRFAGGQGELVQAAELRGPKTSTYEQRLSAFALVPAGEQTDLLVFARAHGGDVADASEAAGHKPMAVRVALMRNGAPLIDVRRRVSAGEAAGFGPLAPSPDRGRLLQSLAASGPQQIIETPDDAGPSLWQGARTEQRFDGLRGGEYLLLEHLHPQHTRLSLMLPALGVEARARIAGMRLPLPMQPGLLLVHLPQERGTIVWRSHFPVFDEGSLSTAELWVSPGRLSPDALDVPSDVGLGQLAAQSPDDGWSFDEDTASLALPRPAGPAIPFPSKPMAARQPRAIPGAPWSQLKALVVPPPRQGAETLQITDGIAPAELKLSQPATARSKSEPLPEPSFLTAQPSSDDIPERPEPEVSQPSSPHPASPPQDTPARQPRKSQPQSNPLLSAQAAEERRRAAALAFERSQARARERERKEREKMKNKPNKAGQAITSFYDSLAPSRTGGGAGTGQRDDGE